VNFEPKLYASPIDLPEGRSGKIQIKHDELAAGTKVTIIGDRQAIFTGRCPAVGRLAAPRRVHVLSEDGVGTWMTDLPEELNQIAELLATTEPSGNVLVGGLGLGVLARLVADRPKVKTVTVIEASRDVIALCAGKPGGFQIVRSDIAKYLDASPVRYDYYLLDTWQGTNEATWWDTVMPLRRAIRRKHGARPKIWCWAEDIMRGQIGQSLTNEYNPANPRTHWYYRGLPKMSVAEFHRFFDRVGLPTWEAAYGRTIDETIARMRVSGEAS
jgi:hypothetical protein